MAGTGVQDGPGAICRFPGLVPEALQVEVAIRDMLLIMGPEARALARKEQVAVAHIPRGMVVEDDPRMRRIVTKVLTSCGMMVRAASDGVDALQAFNQSRQEPDLICADIKMPNMDGREFAKRLRQQGVGVPIIFVSGTIQRSEEGYREKSHIYLVPKPFSPARLAEIVKEMLDKPKPTLGPRQPPPRPTDSGRLPPTRHGATNGYDSGEFKLDKGQT